MGGDRSDGLVKRISGLYVPAEAVARTIPEEDWVKLRRLFRLARQQQMVAAFFCRECKQPIEGSNEDRLVQGKGGKALGGHIVLRCGCTVWRIKGVR